MSLRETLSNGHLYLVFDKRIDGLGYRYPYGIYAFDLTFGRVLLHIYIKYSKTKGEELEGITIWDLDNVHTANDIKGQIHLLMWDTIPENLVNPVYEYFFKHFKVSHAQRL